MTEGFPSLVGSGPPYVTFATSDGWLDATIGRVGKQERESEVLSKKSKQITVLLVTLFTLLSLCCATDSPGRVLPSSLAKSSLDVVVTNDTELNRRIQLLGFQALQDRSVKTGTVYNATMPEDLSNVTVQVVRLRTGSLKRRGYTFNEIQIPKGVKAVPNMRSVVLIYRNLGSYQANYSAAPGYELVTRVVGVLVYSASDLNTTNPLPEVSVVATSDPIVVQAPFTTQDTISNLSCVYFNSSGEADEQELSFTAKNCSWGTLGYYSIQAIVEPSNRGSSSNGRAWKIAVGAVAGAIVLVALLVLLAFLAVRYRERAKISKMEHVADHGETLQTSLIGGSRAPTAAGTRTKPTIEHEYMS